MTMADMPAGEAAVSHLHGSRGSLLDTAIDTRTDDRLPQIHLGLRQFGLGAGLLGGEQAYQAGLRRGGRGGVDRAL